MNFFLCKLAMPYFEHLSKHPTSLLARIYGIYTIKITGTCKVNIMLMAHTMQIARPEKVQRVFDLKGSTVDRKVRVAQDSTGLKTLKDENFIRLHQKAGKDGLLQMFESERAFVQQQLKLDAAFLRNNNIMDYSLLLCIEERQA